MKRLRSNATALIVRRKIMLATVIVVALGGCGKSADEKRAEMVKCSGFSMGLINLRPGSPLASSVDSALAAQGITANDTFPMGAAGQKYANTMDPAKASGLAREGSAAAAAFINKNDAGGIAGFLKDCVAAYKDLGG